MYSNFASRFKRSLVSALVAGACCAPALAQSPAAAPGQYQQVNAAAQRDLAQFVQFNVQNHAASLPPQFPLDVHNIAELREARLGHGFPVYTIDPQDVLKGRADLRSMAKPTGEWRFVITLHERPIGLATLEQIKGRWEVTAFGAAGLAREVDTAVAVHGNAARSNLRFIRIYQAMSDLLEVVSPVDGTARFAPLLSTRQMLQANQDSGKLAAAASADGLLDQSELLGPLRASVKTNLEAFR